MVKNHRPYANTFNHECDFKVEYELFTPENGGRKNIPYQGIRFDFWYECENHDDPKRLYMIYPEFENSDGDLISNGPVLRKGIARMWILNPKWRVYHQNRIEINTTGYFQEGGNRTGKCKVIEIIGLNSNPTE